MTATGRPDYDQAIKLSSLSPGEPIFVIRAGDAVAGDAVRAWAALAYQQGAPAEALELALQQADLMEAWPMKKAPDGPDLPDHRRKQLVSEHGRRAWRHSRAAPTADVALGHQLGVDEVLGRLRPLLTDLAQSLSISCGHIQVETIEGQTSIAACEALEAVFAVAGQDLRARLEAQR